MTETVLVVNDDDDSGDKGAKNEYDVDPDG